MEDMVGTLFAIAKLADLEIRENQIEVMDRGCPHFPSGLLQGRMGIYLFKYGDKYLKIGKAGPKSDARFRSQHYNPNSAQSTLAKSILNDQDMGKFNLNNENVGNWIKQNTRRIDILMDSSLPVRVLDLFESFLRCKFNPKYEGFQSQRE